MSISTTAEIAELAGKNGFTHGVAWAIAVCKRSGSHDGAAEFLLHESGFKTVDFVDAEVDEYDLTPVVNLITQTETV